MLHKEKLQLGLTDVLVSSRERHPNFGSSSSFDFAFVGNSLSFCISLSKILQLRQTPVERIVSKMSVCTNYLLVRWEFLLANIRAFLRGVGKSCPGSTISSTRTKVPSTKTKNNNNNK